MSIVSGVKSNVWSISVVSCLSPAYTPANFSCLSGCSTNISRFPRPTLNTMSCPRYVSLVSSLSPAYTPTNSSSLSGFSSGFRPPWPNGIFSIWPWILCWCSSWYVSVVSCSLPLPLTLQPTLLLFQVLKFFKISPVHLRPIFCLPTTPNIEIPTVSTKHHQQQDQQQLADDF